MALPTFVQNTLMMGVWTTAFITFSLLAVAKAEKMPLVTPINAISHIFFKDEAIGCTTPDPKFWVSGLILNTGAMLGWAAVAEVGYVGLKVNHGQVLPAILVAILITVVAFITDFYIVPKRFTPGFERVISKNALYVVYVCLAIGFALGGMYRQ